VNEIPLEAVVGGLGLHLMHCCLIGRQGATMDRRVVFRSPLRNFLGINLGNFFVEFGDDLVYNKAFAPSVEGPIVARLTCDQFLTDLGADTGRFVQNLISISGIRLDSRGLGKSVGAVLFLSPF